MGATVKETRVKGLSQPAIQQVLLYDALDQSHFLVFVAYEFMEYLAVNKTACDILGYTREELLSLRVTDVAVGPDVQEVYPGLIKMGSRKGVTQIRTKEGDLLPLSYDASEIRIAHLTYYLAIGFIVDPEQH